DKLAPYVGLGWGDPVSSGLPFGFSLEFGVLMQGTPQASMTTSGFAATTLSAADIAAEEKALEDDLSAFTLWPVASIGVNFSF
ncbi:MAG: hypothetical protein Q9M19_01580, partial [Mariprofundaceae bacterium]|nr:hypothetical protein [Mariprofundaceae bacterium]